MLEKYIMDQLSENDSLLDKLNQKMLYLQKEEDSCRNMMKQLMENEDVGLELFSPRNFEDTTRDKLRMIKKQIAGIQLEQNEISEKISKAKENESNYQAMLLELRTCGEDETKKEKQEEFQKDKHEVNHKKSFEDDYEKTQRESDSISLYSNLKRKEELKNILNRVEKCFNLLYSDKSQCKHELINLKYYLKALISEK